MPVGIYHTLGISKGALLTHQRAIEVIGHNIANAETEGYSRQVLDLETGYPLNLLPGQIGSGVKATRVRRLIDEEINKRILDEEKDFGKWDAYMDILSKLDGLFSTDEGSLFNSINGFWEAWHNLSNNPESKAIRSIVVESSLSLAERIRKMSSDLKDYAKMTLKKIEDEVDEINSIAEKIAELNGIISEVESSGRDANDYRDKRDLLLKKLSEKLSISYFEDDTGKISVLTSWGKPLVEGVDSFELSFSGFSGEISSNTEPKIYWGEDDVTDRIVSGKLKGYIDAYREIVGYKEVGDSDFQNASISLDGYFWGEEGSEWEIKADGTDALIVSFEDGSQKRFDLSFINPGESWSFYVKDGVYLNVTRKGSGSILTGDERFKVDFGKVGILGELDHLSRVFIEEVNKIHAGGAGLENFSEVVGKTEIPSSSVVLKDLGLDIDTSSGSFNIYVYDSSGDLSETVTVNYNKDTDTLNDIITQINASTHLTASLSSGRLKITADSGYTFSFGQGEDGDETNLIAALGLNNFFTGRDSSDIDLNGVIKNNPSYISAACSPNLPGDNRNALKMANLQHEKIVDNSTIDEFFGSITSKVGEKLGEVKESREHSKILLDQLSDYRERVSGVSLDEEFADLIKFQYNFAAAARLINVVDELLSTVLSIGR